MSKLNSNDIAYNNTISGLNYENVQDAIDEQNVRLNVLEEKLSENKPIDVQNGSYNFPSLGVGNRYQHLILFEPPFKNIPTVTFTHGIQSYLLREASVIEVARSYCIISITSGYNSIKPVVEWTATNIE